MLCKVKTKRTTTCTTNLFCRDVVKKWDVDAVLSNIIFEAISMNVVMEPLAMRSIRFSKYKKNKDCFS